MVGLCYDVTMQRNDAEGIIISCDFCGTDWDPYDQTMATPMTEGHRGSVICLNCFRHALDGAEPADGFFDCAMCLKTCEPPLKHWFHPGPEPSPGLNPSAAICWDCIRLAAKTFHKDIDIDFRWNPADYPA